MIETIDSRLRKRSRGYMILLGILFGITNSAHAQSAQLPAVPSAWWIAPVGSLFALGFAYFFYKSVMRQNEGTDVMREIAQAVREGAMAYLRQQYKVVAIVFAVLCAVFLFMAFVLKAQNQVIPFAFLTGGFFSGLCGFLGMKTATNASARTTSAAMEGAKRRAADIFSRGCSNGASGSWLCAVGYCRMVPDSILSFSKDFSGIFGR